MDKIKIGVIGCGDIAFRSYLPAILAQADRIELVATCDVDGARADRAKEQYNAQQSFTGVEQMLAQASLDGVIILTPMVPHGPQSIAALEAGKHVYVEKVMAVDMAEADRMVELAEEKNLVLACAPSTILLSGNQRAKELIQGGEIGRVSLAHALGAHGGPARWDAYTSDPAWFYRPGAGPLFDLAVYPAHILTQILGPARRVTAFSGLSVPELVMTAQAVRGQTLKVEVDDTTPMILDFGNTTFATVIGSYNVLSERLSAMQFWGDRGALTAQHMMDGEIGLWRPASAEWEITQLPATPRDRYGLAIGLLHWLDCIQAGKQPVNSARHARHVLEILLSAQVSARIGQAVELTTTW